MNVLQSSKVVSFFRKALDGLCIAFSGSLVVRLLLILVGWFKESTIYKVIIKIMNAISAVFRYSFVYKLFYRYDKEQTYMTSSVFFSKWDKISSYVTNSISKIYNKIKKLNTGSVNHKAFLAVRNGFSLSYENILGLITVVTVVIPATMWNNIYGLLLAFVAAGLYFVGCVSDKRYSLNIRSIGFPMLVFMVSTVIAVVISLDVKDSIRVFTFFVTSFIYMLSVGGAMNTESKIDKFLGFLYTGVVITSVICIIQSAIGIESDLLLVDTVSSGDIRRAFSTFENPNNYAEYLVLFIPFMAAFALNRESNKEKTLYLLMILLPLLALVLTYSRSCWVTFALSAVIFILLYDYKLFPYIIVVGVMAIPFLPDSVWQRILTIGSLSDSSNMYRVEIWTGCLDMLKEWWITGTGLGPIAFSKIYPSYAQAVASAAPHSHMLFLEIVLEMGIIGIISFLFWWISTIKRMLTFIIRRNLNGRKIKNILIASVSSLTAVTFVSGVEYIWFYPRVMIMFFVAAGIMIAAMNILRKE